MVHFVEKLISRSSAQNHHLIPTIDASLFITFKGTKLGKIMVSLDESLKIYVIIS